MSESYVYSFGEGRADGNAAMKDLLGGKGSGLAEMTNAGVPVPPGYTVTTAVCRAYYATTRTMPAGFQEQHDAALALLERRMGKQLGDPKDPLLVSVRSGAKFSMPGMMDTVLNLGLNDRSVAGLAARAGDPRFAWDCYRRFMQMFGSVVLGLEKRDFEAHLERFKHQRRAKTDQDLSADDLKALVAEFKALVRRHTGKEFPQDPRQQLELAREAVFRSWMNDRAIYYRKQNRIPDDIGTAVNVQAMVFGNLGPTSATGVGFTRNPATGENRFYGEYLTNAQGEDVVAGVRTPRPIAELEQEMPSAYRQLREITARLERHYRDVQDFEFTIQEGTLYLLQTRNGKRTAQAAVRIAVEMVNEELISKEEAILRVDPASLDQLLHPQLDPKAKLPLLATGLAASPGAAVGRAVFSADKAAEVGGKEHVILVRKETTPDDIHGMDAAQGILTATGGMTCVAGETMILTDRGLRTAEEAFAAIEGGERPKILSFDTQAMRPVWRPVIAAGRRMSDVITIGVSQTGRAERNVARLTADHRVLVIEDRRLVKRRLESALAREDFLVVVDQLPAVGVDESAPEKAYVAGALFSDGHIRVRPTKGLVVFVQKPTEAKDAFISTVERRFETAFQTPLRRGRLRWSRGVLRGRTIEGFVQDSRCTRRHVAVALDAIRSAADAWVLRQSESDLLEFLAGYVDGDGTYAATSSPVRLQIVVAAGNRTLLRAIVLAGLRLGIVPQVSRNREASLVQITERVGDILARAKRVHGDIRERLVESRCLSVKAVAGDIAEQVNYMGRIREGCKRNLMFGVGKFRRDVVPLARGRARLELIELLDAPIRSYRMRQVAGPEPEMVYNFEVDASEELDKNFVIFTSGLTPILVSNSHAAVVARGMGKPCVSGVSTIRVDEGTHSFSVNGSVVRQGDWISLDGSSGRVMLGQAPTIPAEVSGEFGVFMGWADAVRRLKVRSNSDIPRDAKQARAFGAEGIGLCRTEHMFFAQDRLPHVVAMIMAAPEAKALEAAVTTKTAQLDGAGGPAATALRKELAVLKQRLAAPLKAYRGALAKLLPFQRADFRGLFMAMDGYPVTIRTLDPPLHEFLPKREELMVEVGVLRAAWERDRKRNKRAPKPARLGKAERLLERVEALHEFNPMLGHRGCRLGITYPEITEMQARAIFEAACECAQKGVRVIPEIMIPLVGHVAELRDQAALVRRVAEAVMTKRAVRVEYLVGTMIEVPRAAITADQVAGEAEFFSFGTNDLTQMTFGFSRDDAGKFLPEYVGRRILPGDPFVSIDPDGVGALVTWAVERGRATRPKLKVGICGEHGGDPASVMFCHQIGLDYVSCSPYRVPVARLAAAQAAYLEKKK